MYERLLVPLDGSPLAEQALPYARRFAHAGGSEVTLLRVVPSFEALAPSREVLDAAFAQHLGEPDSFGLQRQVQEEAMRSLEKAAVPLRDAGAEVNAVVREGEDPAPFIMEEAERGPEAVVFMATHGRSGIGRWLLGSVADKVIRHGRGPVLLVRAQGDGPDPSEAAPLEGVVLPLDGSPESEVALPYAAEAASRLGAGITVVRAIALSRMGHAYADYSLPEYAMGEFANSVRAEVKAYLNDVAQRLRDQGIGPVSVSAPDALAADAILDEAGDPGDRLIVMSTHGRTGLGRWLLGSVADRVLRHGSGPLLLVRPTPSPQTDG